VFSRIVLLCVATISIAGCGGAQTGDGDVVAAFYPLAFALAEVAPQGIVVRDLTPPGAEPHDLELDARDVEAIRGAALVVYLGGGFQPALEDALEEREGPALDVLQKAGVRLKSDTVDTGAVDPHVWLDPLRYAAVAREIAAELGHPAGADAFVARLERLDAELERGLARCARRQLVTSHAAFGYLTERYDLEQVPLVGIEPEAEPSPRDLEQLVDRVRATGATTIFFETLVSSELAETVARETGARTAVLDPLEGLQAEQLDAGTDYFDVMRENLAALRAGLGCP